jgi:membrane protease YdiL (CAAX protease family)
MGVLSAIRRTDGSAAPIPITDAGLLQGLGFELLLTATLGLWLWRAGWRPHLTTTRPYESLDPARGMLLWVGAIAAALTWALACRAMFPDLFRVASQTQITGTPHFWLSLVFSVYNAVFEELLWLGLGITAFRRFGVGWATAISIAMRLLAHAYQGPLALVTVLPVGTLFTLYYVRTRRLWPVVVAHAFQDTLALSLLGSMSERV